MMMMQFEPLARQRSLQTLNALVIPILNDDVKKENLEC
jgi:hypothetical protein